MVTLPIVDELIKQRKRKPWTIFPLANDINFHNNVDVFDYAEATRMGLTFYKVNKAYVACVGDSFSTCTIELFSVDMKRWFYGGGIIKDVLCTSSTNFLYSIGEHNLFARPLNIVLKYINDVRTNGHPFYKAEAFEHENENLRSAVSFTVNKNIKHLWEKETTQKIKDYFPKNAFRTGRFQKHIFDLNFFGTHLLNGKSLGTDITNLPDIKYVTNEVESFYKNLGTLPEQKRPHVLNKFHQYVCHEENFVKNNPVYNGLPLDYVTALILVG